MLNWGEEAKLWLGLLLPQKLLWETAAMSVDAFSGLALPLLAASSLPSALFTWSREVGSAACFGRWLGSLFSAYQ